MLDGRDPVRAKHTEHQGHFHREAILDALEPVYVPEVFADAPSIATAGWTGQDEKVSPKIKDVLPPVIAKAALYSAKRTFKWVTADRISADMPTLGSKVAGGEMPRYDMPRNDGMAITPITQDIMVKQTTFSDNRRIEGSETP